MRNAQGYARQDWIDGHVVECDTFTCAHCQHVVFVRPKADPTEVGGFCRQCAKMICPKCVNLMTCTPWEKEMERREAQARFRNSLGV